MTQSLDLVLLPLCRVAYRALLRRTETVVPPSNAMSAYDSKSDGAWFVLSFLRQ